MMKQPNKNKTHLNIVLGLCLIFSIGLKAQEANDLSYFVEAKNEIEAMLNGKEPLNYEKAVFLTENAFHDNSLNYEKFTRFINTSTRYAFELSKAITIKLPAKRNFLVTTDSCAMNIYRATINYAIYRLITDTTIIEFKGSNYLHYPFPYSYSDPLASNNWNFSQVSNLYLDKEAQGNCNALTTLFKILSLRLNSGANICTTQGHVFITHADINGNTYNIELAAKAFPGTGSIETITHTSDEASRNGVAMRELDLKQSIGLCLINLAKGYQHKLNIKPDNFMLNCAELVLKYDSLNLNAMLLKAEALEEILIAQNKSFEQIKRTKEFTAYQNYINELYHLGYREMPDEMKNQIIAAITKDTSYISLNKDKTYYPFVSIDKNDKRSASLSNGTFEEVDLDKPQEKYFRTIFDTKTKKIVGFASVQKLYKNYNFDPVAFGWQIDPLFKKYPSMSPYSAFANNPVLFVDQDGQEFITYIKVKNEETGKTEQHKVTFDGVNTTMQNVQTGASSNYKPGTSQFVDDIVTSYNYIVSNGADVDGAMKTLASSKTIQLEIKESSKKGAGDYGNSEIKINLRSGLKVYDDDGSGDYKGNQSPALGFWSEVYHAYIDLVDNVAKEKFKNDTPTNDMEEEYVHVKKEGQVIDALKKSDPTNQETKRDKTYGEAAWPVKAKTPTSTAKED